MKNVFTPSLIAALLFSSWSHAEMTRHCPSSDPLYWGSLSVDSDIPEVRLANIINQMLKLDPAHEACYETDGSKNTVVLPENKGLYSPTMVISINPAKIRFDLRFFSRFNTLHEIREPQEIITSTCSYEYDGQMIAPETCEQVIANAYASITKTVSFSAVQISEITLQKAETRAKAVLRAVNALNNESLAEFYIKGLIVKP